MGPNLRKANQINVQFIIIVQVYHLESVDVRFCPHFRAMLGNGRARGLVEVVAKQGGGGAGVQTCRASEGVQWNGIFSYWRAP